TRPPASSSTIAAAVPTGRAPSSVSGRGGCAVITAIIHRPTVRLTSQYLLLSTRPGPSTRHTGKSADHSTELPTGHRLHVRSPGIGVCPGNHESAGKRHSGKPRKGNQHLQHVLVECAWAASRTPGYLQSLYRWHVRKFGCSRNPTAKNKAIVAVAHKLAIIIWHVLATGKPYTDLGADYLDRRIDPAKETRRLIARLQALGHTVTIEPAA